MKKIFLAFVILAAFGSTVQAQFTGKKFRGYANAPDPMEMIMEFKNDTLNMYLAADFRLVETMSYSLQGDTMTISKLFGQSPCKNGTSGLYKMVLEENKLFITPIKDECTDRFYAFNKDPWIKE